VASVEQAAEQRIKAIKATSDEKRNALAQHLTPPETARLAASMFTDADEPIECLDLGCGTGMLSVALHERYGDLVTRIDGIEADPILAQIYDGELSDIPHTLVLGDALTDTPGKFYDRVILNPPYKKMAANDPRQEALPVHSANLYSAFLAIALDRLKDGGEVVAIIPRSWTNGEYFSPFRKWAFASYSLDALHVYGSRTEVFADTDVLQETMLVKFSKRSQTPKIKITQSTGKADEISISEYKAEDLIIGSSHVVRIAPPATVNVNGTVSSVGLCPSTGKVVDFRSRDRIYDEKPAERLSVRLVYAGNFPQGKFIHPADIGKGQWFAADDETGQKQLIDSGFYVLVKRFSSKEERRRVVAYLLEAREAIAIENHLNVLHAGTPRKVVPLTRKTAAGLAIWLNSSFIDEWFRDVSGSTQVNAGDIKAMPCPEVSDLAHIAAKWHDGMEQDEIDAICEELL